jgi:hypothetical protein
MHETGKKDYEEEGEAGREKMVVLVTGYDGRALKVHGRGTGIVSFALDPVAFHNRISPEWPVLQLLYIQEQETASAGEGRCSDPQISTAMERFQGHLTGLIIRRPSIGFLVGEL